MIKKIIISIFILSIFLGFLYYSNFDNSNNLQKNIYIKNSSWNTDFLNEVSSKKNDKIELLFILKQKKSSIGKIDYSQIEKNIEIENIFIDEKEVNKNQEVTLNKDSSIKIIGKSKQNNILKNDELNIDIENKQNIEIDEDNTIKQVENKNIILKINTKNIEVFKDNLIALDGENLDFIENIIIGNNSFNTIKIGEKYFLAIEKNILDSGKQSIKILDKNQKKIDYKNDINFVKNDNSIKIFDITPKELNKDKKSNIVLQGSGFSKIISIQINNNTILEQSNFEIISDNLAIVKLPKDLEIGDYYLNIMGTDKIYEIKNIFFTIN